MAYEMYPGTVIPVRGLWGFMYRDSNGDMFTHSRTFSKAHEAKAHMRAFIAQRKDTPYDLTSDRHKAAIFDGRTLADEAVTKMLAAMGDEANNWRFGTAWNTGKEGGAYAYFWSDERKLYRFLASW